MNGHGQLNCVHSPFRKRGCLEGGSASRYQGCDAEPMYQGRGHSRMSFPERPRRGFLSRFPSARMRRLLCRSRVGLGVGLRDVRVVRPSRGPRASRACPGHPRSRASQVVRAPGVFPHRAAPRGSLAFSAETRILPRELASGFSEISGRVLPELRDCVTKSLGSSALPPKTWALPLPRPLYLATPDPGLALLRVGDIRTLGTPVALPLVDP